ncbi:hypothetical protein [Streptomyces sp. NPDC048191]|uniref:hypothetical protein n=1 Tax=Streptomyces sp. NPDC048191 TaxID=3155484 RepID=UPI003407F395
MPSIETAARNLQDTTALWSIGAVRAIEVVGAAGNALDAGLDSPTLQTLALLALCTPGEADDVVPVILPTVFEELGLPFCPVGSVAAQEVAARALAARILAGELTPRELARQINQYIGYELPVAERLALLDYAYQDLEEEHQSLEDRDRTLAKVDAEVTTEARRVTQQPQGPSLPTDSPT